MVSHGEGEQYLIKMKNVVARYVDPNHKSTETYPFNPNGSLNGVLVFVMMIG